MMTSKFRILALSFSIGMLIGFGWICYILDLKVIAHQEFPNDLIVAIMIPILNLMFLAGIISFIVLTKTIRFSNDRITVNYLFRPKRQDFGISEIQGFQWDYLYAAINYKVIILYLKNGKKIKFSDFEYGNFYDIEYYIKNRIPVFKSLSAKPNEAEIKEAFNYGDSLDLSQILQIKFAIYIIWGSTFFILKFLIDHINNLRNGEIIFGIIWVFVIIGSVKKYNQEKIRKKKIKNGA